MTLKITSTQVVETSHNQTIHGAAETRTINQPQTYLSLQILELAFNRSDAPNRFSIDIIVGRDVDQVVSHGAVVMKIPGHEQVRHLPYVDDGDER